MTALPDLLHHKSYRPKSDRIVEKQCPDLWDSKNWKFWSEEAKSKSKELSCEFLVPSAKGLDTAHCHLDWGSVRGHLSQALSVTKLSTLFASISSIPTLMHLLHGNNLNSLSLSLMDLITSCNCFEGWQFMMSSRVLVEFLCWPSFCLSFSCALDGDYSITLKSARRRAALFSRIHF